MRRTGALIAAVLFWVGLPACPGDDEESASNCEGECVATLTNSDGYKCSANPKGTCASGGKVIVTCCVPQPCGDGRGACRLTSRCPSTLQGRTGECGDTSFTCCVD